MHLPFCVPMVASKCPTCLADGMDPHPFAIAVATIALILAAAKAHGRQLRLERESRGHMHVGFGRDNDPWVEALWRRDRTWFWGLLALLACASMVVAALSGDWLLLPLLLGVSAAASFVAAGLASLVRFVRDGQGEATWRSRALGGSLGWWLLVLAMAALVALAWVWPALSALSRHGGVAFAPPFSSRTSG